jgi:hypothetical protein
MPLGKDLWIHNNGLSIICLKDVCSLNEPILSQVEVLDNYVVDGSVFLNEPILSWELLSC